MFHRSVSIYMVQFVFQIIKWHEVRLCRSLANCYAFLVERKIWRRSKNVWLLGNSVPWSDGCLQGKIWISFRYYKCNFCTSSVTLLDFWIRSDLGRLIQGNGSPSIQLKTNSSPDLSLQKINWGPIVLRRYPRSIHSQAQKSWCWWYCCSWYFCQNMGKHKIDTEGYHLEVKWFLKTFIQYLCSRNTQLLYIIPDHCFTAPIPHCDGGYQSKLCKNMYNFLNYRLIYHKIWCRSLKDLRGRPNGWYSPVKIPVIVVSPLSRTQKRSVLSCLLLSLWKQFHGHKLNTGLLVGMWRLFCWL